MCNEYAQWVKDHFGDTMISYQEILDQIETNPDYENPFATQITAYARRKEHAAVFAEIQRQIEKMFYPHFISYPEDAETIEALIRLSMAKRVLEVGMFTGFTTLHMIRGVYPDGMVVAIDNQKVYPSFFTRPEISQCFRFLLGDTHQVLADMAGSDAFDLVYVDSQHDLAHTERERELLWPITRPGTVFVFHDCPPQHQPHDPPESGQIWHYLYGLVNKGLFRGGIFPSADRMDVRETFGPEYRREILPHLGIFIRT